MLAASNQAGLIRALNATMTPDEYNELIAYARDRCGRRGIDKALEESDVDIIMGPGDGMMFVISGTAGQSFLAISKLHRLKSSRVPWRVLASWLSRFQWQAFWFADHSQSPPGGSSHSGSERLGGDYGPTPATAVR